MKINKVVSLPTVRKHIWGNYKQLILNENVLMRAIRIYDGGLNSLHKHNLEEVLLVESGVIRCHIKLKDNSIVKYKMSEGDSILIRRNYPHRIEFLSGDFEEERVRFAQINEVCLGKNKGGDYKIYRLIEAKAATKKPK